MPPWFSLVARVFLRFKGTGGVRMGSTRNRNLIVYPITPIPLLASPLKGEECTATGV